MKTSWIKVNLPWHVTNAENFPDLSYDVQQRFLEIARTKFNILQKPSKDVFKETRKWKETISNLDSLTIYQLLDLAKNTNNQTAISCLEYQLTQRQAEDWVYDQPEVLKEEAENKVLVEQYKMRAASQSFSKHPLCRPGVVIKVQSSDGRIFQETIGSMNASGGVCNDCKVIKDDDVVLSAKIIIKSDKSSIRRK